MHWSPYFSAASRTNSGGVDRDLVGAGQQQAADVLDRSHATAHGQGHEALVGRPRHDVEDGVAILVAGRDVEEGELVGAGGVVDARLLDRVAGVAQADELHALDDAAVLDVEAGDDADLQHAATRPSGRGWRRAP